MQCHSLSLYSLAFSISTYLDSALVPTSNFKWHKLFITGNLVLHTREKPKLCRCSKACGCIFLCPSHMTLFHSGYNLPGLFTSNTVCQSIQEQQWLALNTELKASKLEGISGLWRPGCLLFVYADPVIQLLASMATHPQEGPTLSIRLLASSFLWPWFPHLMTSLDEMTSKVSSSSYMLQLYLKSGQNPSANKLMYACHRKRRKPVLNLLPAKTSPQLCPSIQGQMSGPKEFACLKPTFPFKPHSGYCELGTIEFLAHTAKSFQKMALEQVCWWVSHLCSRSSLW